jgi:hypothetical protein
VCQEQRTEGRKGRPEVQAGREVCLKGEKRGLGGEG